MNQFTKFNEQDVPSETNRVGAISAFHFYSDSVMAKLFLSIKTLKNEKIKY